MDFIFRKTGVDLGEIDIMSAVTGVFLFPYILINSVVLLLCFAMVLFFSNYSVVASLEEFILDRYTSITRRIHLPKHRAPLHFSPSISFMGGGQLWMFAIGVGHYVYENYDINSIKFLASSCGCFAAVPLACGRDPYDWCKADWSKCIEHFESRWLLGCLFDSKHFYFNLWNEYLPEDAHLLCSGRLFISVTQLPSMKNKIISEFATRDELIWAIVGSMCLPFVFIRDFPVKCDAEDAGYVMDGGFSNDSPCLDSYTITVSALHKEADVQPNMKRAQKALSLSDKASSDRLGSSSSRDSNNSISSVSAKFDEDSSDPDADSGAEDSLTACKEEATRKHRHKIRIRSLDIIRVPKYDRVWEISGIGEECALFCRDFGRHEWTSIRKVKEMPHKSAAK